MFVFQNLEQQGRTRGGAETSPYDLPQMRQALAYEKRLRERKEEELQEMEIIVFEFQKTLVEKEETLESDLSQMRNKLDEKERTVDELERALEEQRQARATCEQQTRTTVDEELEQARTHLAQMRSMLEKKEKTVVELQNALEEEQQARTAVDDELSQVRRLCDDLEERLIQSCQQDLQTKEHVIREQRGRLEEEHQQKTDLEQRLRDLEEERNIHLSTIRELQSAVSAREELAQSCDWIIQREEIEILSEKILGRGAWGIVHEGKFRACQVAVKEIHELIVSPHNRVIFEREMSIASRCRHPNLLQFIGATNDDGSPLFVTELLDTSVRTVLSQRALNHEETVSLALDIAKGLNYLHLHKPNPIMHRDISSANVLLCRRDESWRAKLSDYGAANFVRQSMTKSPGAPIYSAPEAAQVTQHSPKVNYLSTC